MASSKPQAVPVQRTFDATFLNQVANDPAVRPWLAGEGVLDLSPVVQNPANFTLATEHGGFVLVAHEPGRYEVHSQFLPRHGAHTIHAMRAAQEWMFTRTPCEAIVSKVPDSNTPARGFAIAGGLKTIFSRDDAALGPCAYVELDIMRWAMGCARLEVAGEKFHKALALAKQRTNSALSEHPHDQAHERAVGAAMLMIERGQPVKGVNFYNRWARLAGYAEIKLLSVAPVVVDVIDAVVGIGDDGVEVLLCR